MCLLCFVFFAGAHICVRVGRVIVVDMNQKRLDLAKRFGADVTINSQTQDLRARVRRVACVVLHFFRFFFLKKKKKNIKKVMCRGCWQRSYACDAFYSVFSLPLCSRSQRR